MGLSIVRCLSLNVLTELLLVILEGQVFCLFNLMLFSSSSLFDLDFVDNVKGTSLVALEVGPSQHEATTLLLKSLEERRWQVGHHISLLDLLKVSSDFLS
jgi:hypothetical protein